MHYTAIHRLASGRGWRLSYEDVRGLIRGLAGHLSKGLHRPLELSYFCIMESSAKRACRVYERVYVCARASTRICDTCTHGSTVMRGLMYPGWPKITRPAVKQGYGRGEISSVKLYDARIFHGASEAVKR